MAAPVTCPFCASDTLSLWHPEEGTCGTCSTCGFHFGPFSGSDTALDHYKGSALHVVQEIAESARSDMAGRLARVSALLTALDDHDAPGASSPAEVLDTAQEALEGASQDVRDLLGLVRDLLARTRHPRRDSPASDGSRH